LLAPCWAHGASEAFLRRVRAEADDRGGVMIHMHLLQSPVHKAYGLRRHGKPTVFWLDDLGLVERNVVYGHAIHVTEAEIELMGRRKVSVTSHPSCNFHMRNGITPVMPLRAAGVNVAMGLDDKTINDDEDAVMELRMMHKVHRLHTFDLATPALSAYEALEIATLNGAKATGFAGEVGALVPGMKGDAILVDLDRVARDPWIDRNSTSPMLLWNAPWARTWPPSSSGVRSLSRIIGRVRSTWKGFIARCARSAPRASRPSRGRGPICSGRSNLMLSHGTVLGTRPCSTSRSIG
jgi:cytosine/adenosine deaminase-related metal-dependent hydrolase